MALVIYCCCSALLLAHAVSLTSAYVDQTLARGAGGCEVIEAVLSKLMVSDVFPTDNGFLRRIAYAETLGGTQSSGDGGPWAVSLAMLSRTQTDHPALSKFKEKLSNSSTAAVLKGTSGGAIDWSGVSEQDLARPLYSAIAARLYLQLQLSAQHQNEVPARLDYQASFWATYYRDVNGTQNKTTAVFLERTKQLDDMCACKSSIDMAFVMDMSGSVGSKNFNSAKQFVSKIVQSFSIGQNMTRVGLITYSTRPHVHFSLTDYSNKNYTLTAINQTPYKGGYTRTGEAIRAMIEKIFNQSSVTPGRQLWMTIRMTTSKSTTLTTAALPASQNQGGLPDIGLPGLIQVIETSTSPPTTALPTQSIQPKELKSQVGIVVTDGKAQDDVLPPSLRAHEIGITMFAIGVGGYKLSELNEIASDPDQAHVFTVGDYNAIENIRASVRRRSCQASAPVSIGQPVSGIVSEDDTTFAAMPIGDEEVTITVTAVEGSVSLYTSFAVPNPSEAFHNQKLTVSNGAQGSLLVAPPKTNPQQGSITRQRRQTQSVIASSSQTTLYLSIHGEASANKFLLESQKGNHLSPTSANSGNSPRAKLTDFVVYVIFLLVISVLVL